MNRPHPPEPAGNDDDVARDAHLRAALRHAPDRDARPPAELSRRILDAARAAAGSAPKRTARPAAARWARVRDGFASCTAWLRHPGATAAFASLMLATVIGVMWRDGPPPETEPVHDGAAPAGPSTAPSAAATAAAPVADRPPARHDEPAETAADAAARDAAAATARRADHDDGGRREAAAPRPRATGSAPSGPPAGKAAAQEKRRSAAPEAANPPVAASPPPPPMAASPAAPAVTPSDRAGAAAQNQAPLGATAERSGLDDGPSAQAARYRAQWPRPSHCAAAAAAAVAPRPPGWRGAARPPPEPVVCGREAAECAGMVRRRAGADAWPVAAGGGHPVGGAADGLDRCAVDRRPHAGPRGDPGGHAVVAARRHGRPHLAGAAAGRRRRAAPGCGAGLGRAGPVAAATLSACARTVGPA